MSNPENSRSPSSLRPIGFRWAGLMVVVCGIAICLVISSEMMGQPTAQGPSKSGQQESDPFGIQPKPSKQLDPKTRKQATQDPKKQDPKKQGSENVKQDDSKQDDSKQGEPKQDDPKQDDGLSKFDAKLAFAHLEAICDIGPRVSASKGMQKQQKYLEKHFKVIGGKILNQAFKAKSPFNGRQSTLHNIIVQYYPERERRLLICCHHDTRPFADADPVNPRGKFIGANDGASGVALLCELGRHLGDMEGPYGIDFIFFDGEEYVINRAVDPMFLGSTYFAQEYANGKVPWKYEYGILVDMVADKDLQIYFEGNSLEFAGGDRLTRSIWGVANQIGVKEFIPKKKHQIRDDHLPLNEIALIPVCDIIDFDYPNPDKGNIYWHTQKDIPENCSAESLGKVGSVVLEWLRQMQKINGQGNKK